MNIAVRHAQIETATLARLRKELEEAREQIRQFKAALAPEKIVVHPAWKLTRTEAMVYRALASSSGVVRLERFMLALYSDRIDDPPDAKIIDVLICKLRKKLERWGGTIETAWGEGYRLLTRPSEPVLDASGLLAWLPILVRRHSGVSPMAATYLRVLAEADGDYVSGAMLRERAGLPPLKSMASNIRTSINRCLPHIEQLGWTVESRSGGPPRSGYRLRKLSAEAVQ